MLRTIKQIGSPEIISETPTDWKLEPKFFLQTLKIRGPPQIDLFVSPLNHQLPKNSPQQPGLGICAVDFLQHSWRELCGYAFPPFCLIKKVLACEGYEGKSLITDHNTSMANTVLINEIFVNVGDTSDSVTQTQNIVMQSTDHIYQGFRGTLASESISGVVATVIAGFRKQGSLSNYQWA